MEHINWSALFLVIWNLLATSWIIFKPYTTAKMKNLAKKQDIEGLTRKVEEVKKVFGEDLERLRAQLAVANDIKVKMYDEQKATCFEVFASLHQLESSAISLPDEISLAIVEDRLREFEETGKASIYATAKAELLFDEGPLIEQIRQANEKMVPLLKMYYEVLQQLKEYVQQPGSVPSKAAAIVADHDKRALQQLDKYAPFRDSKLKSLMRNFLYQRQ